MATVFSRVPYRGLGVKWAVLVGFKYVASVISVNHSVQYSHCTVLSCCPWSEITLTSYRGNVIERNLLRFYSSTASCYIEIMAMSKEFRRVLDRSLPKLCDDLDVDPILPHLIAEELFTDNDREELEAIPVRSKRVVKFVSILKRRSQRAFEVFVKCLEEDVGSKHLADHMKEVYRGITNQQPVSNQIHMQETS